MELHYTNPPPKPQNPGDESWKLFNFKINWQACHRYQIYFKQTNLTNKIKWSSTILIHQWRDSVPQTIKRSLVSRLSKQRTCLRLATWCHCPIAISPKISLAKMSTWISSSTWRITDAHLLPPSMLPSPPLEMWPCKSTQPGTKAQFQASKSLSNRQHWLFNRSKAFLTWLIQISTAYKQNSSSSHSQPTIINPNFLFSSSLLAVQEWLAVSRERKSFIRASLISIRGLA